MITLSVHNLSAGCEPVRLALYHERLLTKCHLPIMCVVYPASDNTFAIVISVTPMPCKLVGPKFPNTPVRKPYRPVKSVALEGVHTLAPTWKSVKRIPVTMYLISVISHRLRVTHAECDHTHGLVKSATRCTMVSS